MGESPSTPTVALINYFTTEDKTIIFLIKKDTDTPLVLEAKTPNGNSINSKHLLLCAQRLITDFNGLQIGWEERRSADLIKECLKLAPEVNRPSKREKVEAYYPGPILLDPFYNFQLTYLEELSYALLPARLKDLIKDCDLLCFAPHGPLHSLPLQALKWTNDQYLIEIFGVCITPSATVLKYCQTKNRIRNVRMKHKPETCFVAAVGALENDPSDFETDVDFLEPKFSRDRFLSLKGSQATKEKILHNIGGKDIIHLACHGLFVGDLGLDPLESGFMFSDGGPAKSLHSLMNAFQDGSSMPNDASTYFLTAREVFNLSLNADLITLRACSSGRSKLLSGDEIMGLTRSFLYAGTPSLIVSLWNVNIKSSNILLKEFYNSWINHSNPLPKWKALQLAQISMIKQSERNDYHHPYHWAPLTLIGDWL
jgi:CHAT domain-containing protein